MATTSSVPADVLARVAADGAADSGGLDVGLLGDFLERVAAAVAAGTPLRRRQLQAYRHLGDQAARQGVALRALLDLYSSAAWRLWRHLPAVTSAASDPAGVVRAGEVMLRAVDDAIAELSEGYQLARRNLVSEQVSARREFVDDLLSPGADLASLLRRADGFGLQLTGPHAVAVVEAEQPFTDIGPLTGTVERRLRGSKGDADSFVSTKDGRLVVVFAAPDRAAVAQVTGRVRAVVTVGQTGVSRTRTGADGVAACYQEARDALDLARRLQLPDAVVDAKDLLVYQVLARDRPALVDLVQDLLSPLLGARGGAEPLLDTLTAFFDAGGNSAETARALHLSVRAVTYRLARVHALTGRDPARAQERFALQAAVLGAKLLGWPATALPAPGVETP